jgi:hypothetical protein
MEIPIEKKQLPDFWFFGRSGIGACRAKGRKSSQKLQFGDQKLPPRDKLTGDREAEWKFRVMYRSWR